MNCRNCGASVPVKVFMVCEYCRTQYHQRGAVPPPSQTNQTAPGFHLTPAHLSEFSILGLMAGAVFLLPWIARR